MVDALYNNHEEGPQVLNMPCSALREKGPVIVYPTTAGIAGMPTNYKLGADFVLYAVGGGLSLINIVFVILPCWKKRGGGTPLRFRVLFLCVFALLFSSVYSVERRVRLIGWGEVVCGGGCGQEGGCSQTSREESCGAGVWAQRGG
ncbi:hypothetical protein JKF63_01707 [Porcisia hertigi]|uniref:Uncharacterized protein n=1 Tax=Porcisia hertigi TaxID=2761500 RepID=A0A836HZW9_9TRYP|nr:hypothetical protein JKF63_01707 [Porcisia hertigi]